MTMREKLTQYVRSLFLDMPDTPRNRDLMEEILQNTLDRYDDLISQGVAETDAYVQASASIGDVQQLWEQPAAKTPKKKRRLWIVAAVVLVLLLLLGAALMMLLDELYLRRGALEYAEEQAEQWSDNMEEQAEQWADELEKTVKEEFADGTRQNGFGSSISYRDADSYTAGTAEFDSDDVQQVYVDWISGSVTVLPYDGSTIQIEERGAEEPEEEMRWLLDGPYLTIRYAAEGRFLNLPTKHLTIRVPKGKALDRLTVDTVSADSDLRDLDVTQLRCSTTSGNLTAVGSFGNAEISSVSGHVSFHGTAAHMEVDTTSGDASVTFTETPDEFSFDGVSGDLKLWLPENRSFELEYDTVSGDLDCEFPTTRSGDEAQTYRAETGSMAELEADTVSGDMEILILK